MDGDGCGVVVDLTLNVDANCYECTPSHPMAVGKQFLY